MIRCRVLAGLLVAACLACGNGGSTPAEVEVRELTVGLRLEPASLSFDAFGDTARFTVYRATNRGRLIEERGAAWATSADSIASVRSDGLVTSVADGSASVSATAAGFSASASAVVLQRPDTVVVQPSTSPVVEGRSIELEARVHDRLGNDMTDATDVQWTSLAPSVVSIVSPGVLLGVVPDSAVVEVRAGEVASDAVVTVVPQDWPNEPPGMTVLTDQPWSALASEGWNHQDRETYSHIVLDPTAPQSGPEVLEHVYSTGFTGDGTEPAVEWINAGGASRLYVGFWFKASAGWQGHPSGINKVMFLWNTPFNANFILAMRGPASGPFSLDIDPEGHPEQQDRIDRGVGGYMTQNVNQRELLPGRWYRIEVLVDHDAGTIDWWQDGLHVGSYSGLSLRTTGFGELQIAPTWGGRGNSAKQRDDYFRYDHIRISTGG